ncbi:diguanylate cyclase/phosphodiesterase [Photobacterium jeanii]|uniref:diguanylate cyclase n=1 Tax=Photobacterium jeanii TaxID=858640 RepID=A0A178K8L6_9GAMM|nr:GGDEF domain-containing protein [Photobacterium jeanii]OAN13084.1 diguanylate cyclase/phosphodiesterase [Photobacterium jeanii]PST89233.1 GGDEF domain-containing protein [Photobacterium jeanii]
MKKVSQLPTRLTVVVCIGVLISAFVPSSGTLEALTSVMTLVLIIMLLREDFGREMKGWLMLALGTYGVGVIADLLDEIPELNDHWLVDRSDDIFMHIGVFLMCLCFIKMLKQRHGLIADLNKQIAKAQRLEQALHRQALHDDLTQLENRRALFHRFDTIALERDHGVLAYIDIDNFKKVNDRFGHQRGDELLVELARSIREISPQGCDIYRIGGDEFAVLMPANSNIASQQWADQLCQTTRYLRQRFEIDLSIGLVPYHAGNLSDPDSILAHADREMYKKKASKQLAS